MKKFWKPLGWIIPELEIVRGLIVYALEQSGIPGPELQSAARSLFDPPGKMIRPGMLLLSARLLSQRPYCDQRVSLPEGWAAGQYAKGLSGKRHGHGAYSRADLDVSVVNGALPLRFYLMAAAIEVLHSATLLHDDVLDSADTRRNMPSVPKRIGNRQAILLGDQLLTLSFQMISEAASMESAQLISRVVGGICRGELMQNSTLYNFQLGKSLRGYRERIAGKTAAMFSLALFLGAREMERFQSYREHGDTGAPNPQQNLTSNYIRRYGYNCGMAFQIIDDVLDLDVSAENGKPKGSDLREGIITLPIINMLKTGSLAEGDLQQLWNEPDSIGAFLMTSDLKDGCRNALNEAELYMKRADNALLHAQELSGKNLTDLSKISDHLLKRRR